MKFDRKIKMLIFMLKLIVNHTINYLNKISLTHLLIVV